MEVFTHNIVEIFRNILYNKDMDNVPFSNTNTIRPISLSSNFRTDIMTPAIMLLSVEWV